MIFIFLLLFLLAQTLPGQASATLLDRETFQSVGTVTSSSPENLSTVTGTFYKRPVGPRVTGDTSVNSEGWSADLHNAIANHQWTVPANGGSSMNRMACAWYFIGDVSVDNGTNRELDLLTCRNTTTNGIFTTISLGKTLGLFQQTPTYVPSATVAIPKYGWVFLAVAFVYDSTTNSVTYRSYYMLPGGALTQLGADITSSGQNGTTITGGSIFFSGNIDYQLRYGCPSLYQISSFSDVAVPSDVLPPPTTPSKWYLNPTTGNDNNDGTSPSTAWATESKLQTETNYLGMIPSTGTGPLTTSGASPGDILYLDCSGGSLSIGTSALTISTAGLTVMETQVANTWPGGTPTTGGYGLDPMETLQHSGWSLVNGLSNTYSTTDGAATDLTSIVVFEDGKYLNHPVGSSLSAVQSSLDSTAGSFWTDGTTIYLHTFEGDNPNTSSHLFRRTRYRDGFGNSAVVINTPNVWWDGLVCAGTTLADKATNDPVGSYCYQWNISTGGGTNLLSNFNVDNYSKHGVGRTAGGSDMICTRQNGVYGRTSPYIGLGAASADVDFSGDATSANNQGIYLNCSETVNQGVVGSATGAINTFSNLSWLSHASVVAFSNVSFTNCNFVSVLSDQGSCNNISCANTTCAYASLNSPATFNRCQSTGGVLASSGATCTIENSIIKLGTTPPSNYFSGTLGLKATILGCVFDLTNTTVGGYTALYTRAAAGSSLTIQDCLFLGNTTVLYAPTYGYSSADTIVSNHNVYSPTTAGIVNGAAHYTSGSTVTNLISFSDWQADGYESGSTLTSSPLVDATYKPQTGSPCIIDGVNIGPLMDFSGATFALRQTVGIYEVTGSNELNVYFGSSNVAGLIDAGYAASGQVVNVSLGYALSPNTVLTVIDNTSSSPIGGTFSNLPNGGTLSLAYQGAVYNLTASYSGGSGHDLTLTYTGESNTSGSVNSTDSPVMSPLDLCLLAALIFGLAAKSLPRPQPVRVE